MSKQPISSLPLFLAGIAILPTIVLQSSIMLLLLQVILLAIGAWRAGKHIRPLYFLVLISSVTFFHLLSPFGEVLYAVGSFLITEGALKLGLRKGLVVTGLVVCSLCTVRPDLRLPGHIGRLLSRLFYYFEALMEHKSAMRRRALLTSIDQLLLSLLQQPPPALPVKHATSLKVEYRWNRWHRAMMLAMMNWLFLLTPQWFEKL